MNNSTLILIIDDDESIRHCLVDIIMNEGHQVVEASNGREGLALLSSIPPPALVLVDMNMPLMDGPAFYQSLRQDPRFKDTPVVFITAAKDISRIPAEVKTLRKPFDLEDLTKIIQSHCSVKLLEPEK